MPRPAESTAGAAEQPIPAPLSNRRRASALSYCSSRLLFALSHHFNVLSNPIPRKRSGLQSYVGFPVPASFRRIFFAPRIQDAAPPFLRVQRYGNPPLSSKFFCQKIMPKNMFLFHLRRNRLANTTLSCTIFFAFPKAKQGCPDNPHPLRGHQGGTRSHPMPQFFSWLENV